MNNFIVELGHIALVSALVLSVYQFVIVFFKNEKNYIIIPNISVLVFSTTLFSFLTLIYAFLVSDFSVDLVSKFSHSSKPLIYKISGTWANHEGSLLLWILILTFFSAVSSSLKLPERFHSLLSSVQGLLNSLFLSLCIFTSNPFYRSTLIPNDGLGLNPILQDLLLAFHPPVLYIGYVGLSVSFSYAIAALINGEIDKKWAALIRPWIILSWVALTLGITLGSYWAYYELGWGGWWFWDPVENAALMPWLLATALLHSVIVLEMRNELKAWTILLCILGFSFSLLGTFIVRSGVITSVHSFASDPERGLVILTILFLSTAIPLCIFALKANLFHKKTEINFFTKEMSLIINNFILVVSSFIILIGTMYPLFLEILNGSQITVGAPFFVASLSPFMISTLFFMGIGPLIYWKKNSLVHFIKIFRYPLLFTLLIFLFFITFLNLPLMFVVSFSLSFWLIINIIYLILDNTNILTFFKKDSKIKSLSKYHLAVCVAHIGVSVFAIGAVSENYFNEEVIESVKPGEKISIGKNYLIFDGITQKMGPNYISEIGKLTLLNIDGEIITQMFPEKRMFPIERQSTTEVAIHRKLSGDLYAVLGDGDSSKGYTLRIYYKPLVSLIWMGALLMALGGVFSLIANYKKRQIHQNI